MMRPIILSIAILLLLVQGVTAQEKQKKVNPNVSYSKEYPNVLHSPSSEKTPRVFRSVLQLEVILNRGDEPEILYADGTVVSSDGLIATVIDAPGANQAKMGGIESAAVLMLDGSSAGAKILSYSPAHGVAIFRVADLELPHLTLSTKRLLAKQRASWHAVYQNGGTTVLYTRPLQMHKSALAVGATMDLCQVIDMGSSALSAERSGSAVVSLDGNVIALMGRQKHWEVTPKNELPRRKLAWAVPASVIAKLLKEVEGGGE